MSIWLYLVMRRSYFLRFLAAELRACLNIWKSDFILKRLCHNLENVCIDTCLERWLVLCKYCFKKQIVSKNKSLYRVPKSMYATQKCQNVIALGDKILKQVSFIVKKDSKEKYFVTLCLFLVMCELEKNWLHPLKMS